MKIRFGLLAAAWSCFGLPGAATGETLPPAADGFANVGGATTGGAGGPVVTVSTLDGLRDYARRSGAFVVQISGTIEDSAPSRRGVQVASQKTFVGLAGAVLRNINFATKSSSQSWTRNLIFRNLTMIGSPQDCISLRRADHVWIDHCDFSDTDDGLVDITRLSDYVTVSWCHFHYSDAFEKAQRAAGHHHFFPMLIGETDHDTDNIGKLHVTLHHNWFGPNAVERMPSVRFGTVHVYNNYYDHISGAAAYDYCVEARLESQVLVQNNDFDHCHSPQQLKVTSGRPPVLEAAGNLYEECDGNREAAGKAGAMPYGYRLDEAGTVKAAAMAGAGVLK